jgi:hypothetical protein
MKRHFVALMACANLAGCSTGSDVPAAERGIRAFHAELNAGKFEQIYDDSGPELKSMTSKDKFLKILTAVHSKLGAYRTGQALGWNDNVTTSGHFVSVRLKATYQKGSAEEAFGYRVDGDRTTLVGYHVNSDAFL